MAVVKLTVLLADMNDFAKVNDVYKTCEYGHAEGIFNSHMFNLML